METFSLILVGFCVGWTVTTLPCTILIFSLGFWANYENAKHQKKLDQLLSEDKD